jgi:hypothetical protein
VSWRHVPLSAARSSSIIRSIVCRSINKCVIFNCRVHSLSFNSIQSCVVVLLSLWTDHDLGHRVVSVKKRRKEER